MPTPPPATPRALLSDLFRIAVKAAAPGPALLAALESRKPEPVRAVHILALGKAAHPMAGAAVEHLRQQGRAPAGGILIGAEPAPAPHPALRVVTGEHPEPGAGSLAAARALGEAVARVGPEDEAWVLLSGGTTSLIAAPIEGISPEQLTTLYRLLLGSGLDISAMNRIRKRFSLWGGGRLTAALAPACVKNFTISDVIGDDLGSIGSGPCVPDDSSAAEVRLALTSAGLWEKIPDAFRTTLTAVEKGLAPETPKPGDPAFRNLETRLVASNRLALEAMVKQASQLGVAARVMGADLAGEASETGRHLATLLLTYSDPEIPQPALHKNATVLIWGGETTVTLGPNPGRGGRNQELALAAAQVLAASDLPSRDQVTILSAGTDGRDGPTDAAGAIVDASTWAAIRKAGRDPARDLRGHDANPALEAGHALLITGMTGTNVMDVVAGLIMPAGSAHPA